MYYNYYIDTILLMTIKTELITKALNKLFHDWWLECIQLVKAGYCGEYVYKSSQFYMEYESEFKSYWEKVLY